MREHFHSLLAFSLFCSVRSNADMLNLLLILFTASTCNARGSGGSGKTAVTKTVQTVNLPNFGDADLNEVSKTLAYRMSANPSQWWRQEQAFKLVYGTIDWLNSSSYR